MGGILTVEESRIHGVSVARSDVHADSRGSFARLFCIRDLADVFGRRRITQINHSVTKGAGVVRGLHYQVPPHAEMKFVRCLRGRVWDVAVDLRAGSPTFLQWIAHELSPHNMDMMIIPEGCAHGFQTLEKDSELLYLHTADYAPHAESGIRPTDPSLSILWPVPIEQLSERDEGLPLITTDFTGLKV